MFTPLKCVDWLGYDVELEKEQTLASNEMFEIEGIIGRNHWQTCTLVHIARAISLQEIYDLW